MNERTPTELLLAEILDGVSALQEKLVSIEERIDLMGAEQIAKNENISELERHFARLNEDRESTHRELQVVAELAARAHAAALGSASPLPADLLTGPVLERFLLAHPPAAAKTSRALDRWREAASGATAEQVFQILVYQYRGSPSDTAETLALRFQLAAISREELARRGSMAPPPPKSIPMPERSAEAIATKSEELIVIWEAGETPYLHGEPELADAAELVENLWRKVARDGPAVLQSALQALHVEIIDRLRSGERPAKVLSQPFDAAKEADCARPSDSNLER